MSKEKHFYFFDLNEVLIDRYPAQIADQIKINTKNSNFVFIFSEEYSYSYPKKIPVDSKAFFLKDLSKKNLDLIVAKYPPNSLTTIAQRIPDMWMLTYFNHLSVPTFIVQHGLWSDKLERIPLIRLLLEKFSKFNQYLKNAYAISRINKIPFLPTVLDLYKFLLKENITIPETKYLHNDKIRAAKAFVFDKSWDDYYTIKYGYNSDNIIYIGNPDLQLLKNRDLSDKEDAVCYLCQSLVEDGRYSLKEYTIFLQILKDNIASRKKLIIKLHPRSRKEYYKIFEGNENVVMTDNLPFCEYYIGHYTGLLATVKYISDNILIWQLPNHHTPEFFYQFGSIVTDSKIDLRAFIDNNNQSNKDNPQLNEMKRDIEILDPIQIISENIMKYSIH